MANDTIIEIATDIVAAYVANNHLPKGELTALIETVHATIANLGGQNMAPAPVVEEKRAPAVSIKKSLHDDHLVCLEDGKSFKSLKRHLRTEHDLTPDQYRAKWGLPHDYPMVAPDYAAQRSQLAKSVGLGRKPGPMEKRPKK